MHQIKINYDDKPSVRALEDQLILEAEAILYRRFAGGAPLSSPDDVRSYLRLKLGKHEQEMFGVIFLDTRNRVLGFEELFRGTIDSAAVYPREVAKRALQINAAAIIVAHNHPSGDAEPSKADGALTTRLRDALALLDIRLLDHFVCGREVISFAERGLL